jgi:hypothetical protein
MSRPTDTWASRGGVPGLPSDSRSLGGLPAGKESPHKVSGRVPGLAPNFAPKLGPLKALAESRVGGVGARSPGPCQGPGESETVRGGWTVRVAGSLSPSSGIRSSSFSGGLFSAGAGGCHWQWRFIMMSSLAG